MSSTASDAGSIASKPDSLLFSLPGELRNEIYRWILRGTHIISAPPNPRRHRSTLSDDKWRIKDRPGVSIPYSDLSILSVSKAVRDEALPMLYSESIFRIYVPFEWEEVVRLLSLEAVERMMNIELDVVLDWAIFHAANVFPAGSNLECMDRNKQVWKATLGWIGRKQIIRSTLKIRWRICLRHAKRPFLQWPNVGGSLPEWMYRTLKPLIRFRTLMLQVFIPREETCFDTVDEGLTVFGPKMEAIMEYLVPILGPCVIDNAYDHDHRCYVGTMAFHPQQHIPAILKRRAEALRAEADELELEAEMAELSM